MADGGNEMWGKEDWGSVINDTRVWKSFPSDPSTLVECAYVGEAWNCVIWMVGVGCEVTLNNYAVDSCMLVYQM